MDEAGLYDVKIFASSGFDEYKIARVISEGAKIDAFGVGTKVGVSADAPFVDIVYKMVRFKGSDKRKLSPGKLTLAGEKQVFRKSDRSGQYQEDIVGLRNESIDGAVPLLEKVMEDGKIRRPHFSLQAIQDRFKNNFSSLPDTYKSIHEHTPFPVRLSRRLEELQKGL